MTVPVPDQLEFISDANGATKDFPYPKRFLQKDEIVVALRNTDGIDTPQILGTHYTIAGSSWPTGGTVSFITAPQVPNKVVRYRMTQAKQTVDLENKQRNDAKAVEVQLDRLTMAIQDRGTRTDAAWFGLLAEIAARVNGDKLLNDRVDQEIIDRKNGDDALASLIGQSIVLSDHFFESQLALSFAVVSPLFKVVAVGGYESAGDSPLYSMKRVEAEPEHAGKRRSLDRFLPDGSLSLANGGWWELIGNTIDIRVFGGKADGSTDNSVPISNASNYLLAKGGGIIDYPAGVIGVGYSGDSGTQRVAVFLRSGVYHRGRGRGATTIKLLNNALCHTLMGRGCTDYGVSALTIDGNRGNQGDAPYGQDPEGLSFRDTSTRGIFRDLHIKNTYDYGIGVQLGRATDNLFENILIEDVGSDGIDFKNTTDNSTGNKINNVTVRRFGLLGETGETFAGVDIRGQVMASQIRVEEIGGSMVTTGRHGIRIEGTEAGGSGGLGGHQTIVDGFFLEGLNGSATASTSVVGIQISGRMCSISNGRIRLTGVGVLRAQRECVISNITIEQCRRGWVSMNNGEATDADNDSIATLIIRDCKELGVVLRAGAEGNTFLGAVLRGNEKNLQIEAGANNNRFIGGQCNTPTGATNYTDAGTGTVITSVQGITTRSSNMSAQFPVSATGLQTITLAHNLVEIPLASQCQVSVFGVSSDAAVLGSPYVSSIDSINLTIKVPVIAAAPAGHTARLTAECAIKR